MIVLLLPQKKVEGLGGGFTPYWLTAYHTTAGTVRIKRGLDVPKTERPVSIVKHLLADGGDDSTDSSVRPANQLLLLKSRMPDTAYSLINVRTAPANVERL